MLLTSKNLLTTHEAQTLPKPRSFELRVQRYYNFPNPPNVWQTFFQRRLLIMILWRRERPALTCDGLDLLCPETIYPQKR